MIFAKIKVEFRRNQCYAVFAMAREFNTYQYAARMNKAAIFAGEFHKHGVTCDVVRAMSATQWKELAASISKERGEKVNPPNPKDPTATVEEICRQLAMYPRRNG